MFLTCLTDHFTFFKMVFLIVVDRQSSKQLKLHQPDVKLKKCVSCSSGTCLKRIRPLGDIDNNISFKFHFIFMLLQAVSWQAVFPLCGEPCSQSQLIKMISPPYKHCSCLPALNFSHLVFILLLISCRHCFVCAMALFLSTERKCVVKYYKDIATRPAVT